MKRKNILKLRRNLRNVSRLLAESKLPALEAEMLLAYILQTPRTYLFAHPETKVDFADETRFWRLVEKRHEGEPVAYLTGEKEFYGLRLKSDRRALIPRPETEELVLEALRLSPKSVADIGTGSGAIALALASHLPKAKIFATDISEEALDLARENAHRLGLSHRVKFLRGNLVEPLPEAVELIVANLPYIISSWIDKLSPEIKKYEPRIALDGGPDGMTYYRELFEKAKGKLKPNGQILYELDGRVLLFSPTEEPRPGSR